MTIKEIRRTMRNLNKDGRSVSETVLIPGYGQIKKESWVLDDIKRKLNIA